MPAREGIVRRLARAPLTWILVFAGAWGGATLVDHWAPSYDGAVYLELAESVAAGEGLRYQGHAFPKYPPGLPALLAPFTRLSSGLHLAVRTLLVAFALAGLAAAYRLLARRDGTDVAAGAVVATACALPFVESLPFVASEMPYLLAWTVAILAGERLAAAPSASRTVVAGVLCLIAALLRTTGLTLLPALALGVLLHPGGRIDRRRVGFAAGLVGLIVLYLSVNSALRGTPTNPVPDELPLGSTYGRQLLNENPFDPESRRLAPSEIAGRVTESVPRMLREFGRQLSAGRLEDPTGRLLLGALWVPGFLLSLVRRRRALDFAVAAHLGPLAFWPFLEARYLLLLLPFVLGYLLWSAQLIFRALGRERAGRRVIILLTLVFLGAHVTRTARVIASEHAVPYERGRPGDTLAAFRRMATTLPADAVVIADRAPWAHLYTGLQSYGFPRVDEPARVLAALDRHGATHVVACHRPGSRRFLEPVLRAWPARFSLLFEIGETRVYQFRRRGG